MSLPNPKWLALEAFRFVPVVTSYFLMKTDHLPKGDGHPILLLPGLATNDASTIFIRRRLSQIGYEAHHWRLGWNVRFDESRMVALRSELDYLYDLYRQPVSIIGISLGGVYARFLANYAPEKVRQIITLGSPFAGEEPIQSYGAYLYNFLNKDHTAHDLLEAYGDMFRADPSVPSTSIYSKTDGIVHWKYSIQNPAPTRQNIEVMSGHISLACNPIVINIIADRLQYTKDNWQEYNGE